MRTLLLIPLGLLATACWTPGPGQVDPTRYPWDQPRRAGTYCVIALEPASGIVIGGNANANAVQMACKAQPNAR